MSTRFMPLVLACAALASARLAAQTTWLINNTTNIGGNVVTRLGNPQVISTPYGNAVQFNGINDGLIVSNNPLAGMTNLTIEMIYRHDPLTVTSAWQPRIVHIQANPTDHRVTLETRVYGSNYFLDTFLKLGNTTGVNNNTLYNTNHNHPLGSWAHMAGVYDGTNFKNYVDGRFEESTNLAGPSFAPGGATWIGQRSNNTNYFQGAVLALRFTPRVLSTNEFMCIPQTHLNTPQVSSGQTQLDFNLTNGLPIGFTLMETEQAGGSWSASSNAVLSTNSPGISFRFTAPADSSNKFYRIRWP